MKIYNFAHLKKEVGVFERLSYLGKELGLINSASAPAALDDKERLSLIDTIRKGLITSSHLQKKNISNSLKRLFEDCVFNELPDPDLLSEGMDEISGLRNRRASDVIENPKKGYGDLFQPDFKRYFFLCPRQLAIRESIPVSYNTIRRAFSSDQVLNLHIQKNEIGLSVTVEEEFAVGTVISIEQIYLLQSFFTNLVAEVSFLKPDLRLTSNNFSIFSPDNRKIITNKFTLYKLFTFQESGRNIISIDPFDKNIELH